MDKKEANGVLFSKAHEKLGRFTFRLWISISKAKVWFFFFFFFFIQIIKHRRLYDLLKKLSEQEQGNNISGFQLKYV